MLLYVHGDQKDSQGRGAEDGHLDFHTAMRSEDSLFKFQCCFTSTETKRTVKDGEPRTATSTFTQLLNSEGQYDVFMGICTRLG